MVDCTGFPDSVRQRVNTAVKERQMERTPYRVRSYEAYNGERHWEVYHADTGVVYASNFPSQESADNWSVRQSLSTQ